MSTFQSKPTTLKGSEGARAVLKEFISQLTEAEAPSHWYIVNSSGDNDYDLRNLFGMTDNEYKAFLLSAGLFKQSLEKRTYMSML